MLRPRLKPLLRRWGIHAVAAASLIQIYTAGSTGTETLQLQVNQEVVATFQNVGGNPETRQFQLLQAEIPADVTADQIRVALINDDGPRDLRVDRIVINGTTFQTESPSVWSTGTWTPNGLVPGFWESEWLHGNGWFQFSESQPGSIPGKLGSIAIDDQWTVIADPVTFSDAVAMVGPVSLKEGDPGAVSVRLVDDQGFDVRFQEWAGEDGPHASEQAAWMLLPRGRFVTSDGSLWETGVLELNGSGQWQTIDFETAFDVAPQVFLTLQTNDGNQPLIARLRNVSSSSFDAALYPAESQLTTINPVERVGYLAIRPAAESGLVTIGDQSLPYRLRTLPADSRLTSAGRYSVQLQEDRSLDEEAVHLAETVSLLDLGGLVLAQAQTFHEADPFAIRMERVPEGIVLPAGFRLRQIVPGHELEDAVAMEIAADGRIFVAEESGLVWVVANGIKQPEPWFDLRSEVFRAFADEGALSAFALDPDFLTNGYVYALYPTQVGTETFGRLARFRKSQTVGDGPAVWDRKILLGNNSADGLIHDLFHNVGDLEFGIDGSLFVSWGDAAGNAADDPGQLRSQQLKVPAGKVFRINPATGLGYRNNPFYRSKTSSWESRVWAFGLRNGFRITIHPYGSSPVSADSSRTARPGRLYIGDVGRYRHDELNISKGGENFGWPRFEGTEPYRPSRSRIRHTAPSFLFPHPQNRCVIAGDFYAGTAWPELYRNGLFVADFVEGWLRVYKPNAAHTAVSEVAFGSGIRGVTDLKYDPATGSLLFLGRGGDLIFNDQTGMDGLFRLEYGDQ